MTTRQSTTFLARDAYATWKRRVATAEKSVLLFGPNLDRIVVHLLKHRAVAASHVTVVTDMSPPANSDYMKTLRAVLSLLDDGVEVRTLSQLRANILLTDDELLTFGSQQFNSVSRRTKECTVAPTESATDSDLITTLHQWLDASDPVDRELVARLLASLGKQTAAIEQAQQALLVGFDEAVAAHDLARRKARAARLALLEQRSRYRFAHHHAFASIQWVTGESNEYLSLVADHDVDLTRWMIDTSGDRTDTRTLGRLSMCPVMIADSGQLGFARVGKTRITYVRQAVDRSSRPLGIGGRMVSVSISLPTSRVRDCNVIATVKHNYLIACDVRLLFDGERLTLVGIRRHGASRAHADAYQHFEQLCHRHFTNAKSRSEFFHRFMDTFTYKTLDRDNPNASSFFDGRRFRLSLIEFADTPVLVASKVG